MPNHVTHRIVVTGPMAALDRFVATFIGKVTEKNWKDEEEEYTTFDFNNLVPMPELIRNSESTSAISNGLAILGRTDVPASFGTVFSLQEMLNLPWAQAAGIVDTEALKKFLLERDPSCVEKAEHAIKTYEECGHTDWYSWSIDKWGTKWNAYGVSVEREGDERLVLKFDTAWSPPEPIFVALATREEVRGLKFDIKAFDEGWCFAYVAAIEGGHFLGEGVKATPELYELVYGRKPEIDEDEDEGETEQEEAAQ